MYELGTNHTRLWRSSKNEWFGDTPGFYWATTMPRISPFASRPSPIPTARRVRPLRARRSRPCLAGSVPPVSRPDRRAVRVPGVPHGAAGQRQHHGRQNRHRRHGLAPHGVGRHRKPNQREWRPDPGGYANNDGLYPSGYYLFRAELAQSTASQRAPPTSPPRRHPTRTVSGRGGFCRLPMPTPGLRRVQSPIIARFGPTISPRRSTRGAPPTVV